MTNLQLSSALADVRIRLQRPEHEGLRNECNRYANLLIEATPGRSVRREAEALLKRAHVAAETGSLANSAEWRVHTARLLAEITTNAGTSTLHVPLNIFRQLLALVGERAAQINDAQLNALMARLAIYSCADPDSPEHDPILTKRTLAGEVGIDAAKLCAGR